jgi:hypothetical protein
VYSLSDLSFPNATYDLLDAGWSGIIVDNILLVDGDSFKIMVYEICTSITVPLKQIAIIETIDTIRKVLKVGHELVLGCLNGYI